jgi:nucleoside-triphosphatase THEP1
MVRDILACRESLLFVGPPGVGKTTAIREIARVLADELHLRVVVIDTSNEIGGDGDVPHPAIGGARRMQVPLVELQHRLMIEAVQNHMPEVIIVDEVGTEAEALACRTIAERGVQLIATAHGRFLGDVLKNPSLSDLIGGIQTVTLGDEEARTRGTQKSILERKGPVTFTTTIEMRERALWIAHDTEASVDALLTGRSPTVELRTRAPGTHKVVVTAVPYDATAAPAASVHPSTDADAGAWASRLGDVQDKEPPGAGRRSGAPASRRPAAPAGRRAGPARAHRSAS